MTCPACQEAETNPSTGMYQSECLECSARALSHSPAYFDAARSNSITPAYRDALQAVFGDGWKAGHERVKFWSDRRKA